MKIICIGSSWVASDNLGMQVYATLAGTTLPDGVEVVDGGICGLDLLRFVGDDPLVFVDSLQGFGAPGSLIVVGPPDLESVLPSPAHYNHTAGLAYLLRVITSLYPKAASRMWLVGVETNGLPPGDEIVAEAVAACLRLASGEMARC